MKAKEVEGTLVIVGGAEGKAGERAVLREFVRLAGGHEARVVVMTVATDLPQEVGDEYAEAFRRLGAAEARVVVIDAGAITYTSLPDLERGDALTLHDVRLHVLAAGHLFDPKRRAREDADGGCLERHASARREMSIISNVVASSGRDIRNSFSLAP